MKPFELREALRGVMAFAPTPFMDDGSLDGDGVARQVAFLARRGPPILAVAGCAGGFSSLCLC